MRDLDLPPTAPGQARIFVVAGEASGEALAAPLMAALWRRLPAAPVFAGIGGEAMRAEGLASLFPMEELSLMGLVEVLPHLPRLYGRLRQTEAAIRTWRPHVVVTVDAPGFNFRLARRLAGSGIPLVHYVAPTVWAWRPGRARRIAPLFRHLLALLPFEPPLFERWGLTTTYVGHPVLETVAAVPPRDTACGPEDAPLLCLLPGSRRGELARLLPVYAETVALLRRRFPGLATVLPTLPARAEEVRRQLRDWNPAPEIVTDRAAGLRAMRRADVALAASGTVTLELALLGTPTVAAYRANPITVALVRRLILLPYVTLVNIILGRHAIPELLQENCTPAKLAREVERLLEDPAAAAAQRAAFAELATRMAVDMPPSERAAAVIAGVVADSLVATGAG